MPNADALPKLLPLVPSQLAAVEPRDDIWLSASAGTGKTQVLTARVIRLLLTAGVRPENLLCITFTKAGAAEMSERINRQLAAWVQKKDSEIASDLQAIGADYGPEAKIKARQLFASVLDAPGGGLQIMTIHSFCQSILGSFPEEAGLVPGFKAIEGREQAQLFREALSGMILSAQDGPVVPALQTMSLEMGEDAAMAFLRKCAAVPDVMASIPDGAGALIWARRLAEVGFDGPIDAYFEEELSDHRIDRASIETVAAMNREWGGARGNGRAEKIETWLAMDPAARAAAFDILHGCWWSASKNEPMVASKGFTPPDDRYADIALDLALWTKGLIDKQLRAQYAERLANAVLVGKAFATEYAQSKSAHGVVDFDDMIRKTAGLLNANRMSEWIRYKLDRRTDHILVDESQDTNKAQWDIIRALSDDFYSEDRREENQSERSTAARTIFSVGDFKQAIYGFQGTAPERYREAGDEFEARIGDAGVELKRLDLSQSFRSTPPILRFVNALIASSGHEAFGIDRAIAEHASKKADIGLVELLEPVTADVADEGGDGDDEESWVTSEKRLLAQKLADHAKALIDEAPWLTTQNQRLRPGDIMFLLRSRGELASLLVAQLHERGVPVAGIDRLRLLQPLVVQDLLATVRFVLQPDDDLSLACLLVSPLFGWSQERLLERGYRPDKSVSLWQHLRGHGDIADELAPLEDMLGRADFVTVYDFLEHTLSGPVAGRRKFAARLGNESLVPMEEMLNAAIQFEQQQGGGLQNFLDWFDSGDIEIKREGESDTNEVRVMTVHGAKGLQAPVVILADTTADPTKKPDRSAELLIDEGRRAPLLPIRKAEESARLADIVEMQKKRESAEHMRLLYVAVTRAEERLIMTGSLGISRKGVAPEQSWYAALERGMLALGAEWNEDATWGRAVRHLGMEGVAALAPMATGARPEAAGAPTVAPPWLFADAPGEQKPPRPLVPSRLDDDDYGDAPASTAMRVAAERGKLIHALFERIEDGTSLDRAARWLFAQAGEGIDANALLAEAKAITDNPEWADLFGPDARAEVPIAAVVGETVVSGRIDRLVVTPGHIRLLDFKTGRSVPADANSVAIPYLRQMAHYVAALEVIFPAASVEAALLFTHAPRLVELPPGLLAQYKPQS